MNYKFYTNTPDAIRALHDFYSITDQPILKQKAEHLVYRQQYPKGLLTFAKHIKSLPIQTCYQFVAGNGQTAHLHNPYDVSANNVASMQHTPSPHNLNSNAAALTMSRAAESLI